MALEIFRLVGSVFVDTEAADKSLKKTDKDAGKLGETLVNGVKSVGKFAAGVAATAAAAGAALVGIAENTREYRTEQGKLTTAFETAGHSSEEARKTYEALNGVLGDSGQAVEASSHLAKLVDNEKDLNTWTKICTGVYATFGDSLPIEGLTEAANETAKTGALTGSLADALNWAGVNEDKFQEQLDACTNEQERQALITKTLNGLYDEAADAYRENNAEVIAANEAQDKLNNTMAKIGGLIEPIITKGKELLAEVLEKASPYIETLATVVIPWLVDAISNLVNWFDDAIQAVQDVLSWFQQMGAYAADSLRPIIDDLASAFDWVKQQLEPLITALSDYFTSGEAAEDITNAVKGAIDFLADAYAGLKGFVESVAQGFQDVNTWMAENETLTGLIAIAVGTLTAAIVAYNIAQAIKNAGGIAEIAQLALLQIQLWGLTAAQAAQTVATTIATAATTAFGAVMAFVTSPITLVVLAIGALIAIIYLLVTNWDTVKEAAVKCWEWIKETWNKVAEWFDTNVIQPVVKFFTQLGEDIGNAFSAAWTWIKDTWAAAGKFFSDIWTGIKNAFGAVGSWFKDTFSKAWTAVKNVFSAGGKIFDGIKDGIANVFKTVVNGIIGGINKVIAVPFKAINNALSKIRDLSILGVSPFTWIKTFDIPQIPKLETGAVLEKGQVGLLEGNGAEAVVPLHQNRKWISAVARDMDGAISGTSNARVVALLTDILEAIEEIAGMGIFLDKDRLVGELAKPMDRKLGQLQAAKGRS